MEQYCPRCHEQQVFKASHSNVARHAGLLGMLIASSAASYSCPTCGKIALAEFPEEFQSSIKKKRTFMIVGAALLLVGIIAAMAFLELS